MTPAGARSAGVSRYTRDLSAALGRAAGIHLERLVAPDASGPPKVGRAMRGARALLTYYPGLLDRTATRRDVDVIHCPGPMVPLRTAIPLVVTVHDVLAWRSPSSTRAPARHSSASWSRGPPAAPNGSSSPASSPATS